MAYTNRRALVIGAGIGGLSAALALRQAGLNVQIFEAVPQIKEVGAGVTVWSNAVRALQKLGLSEALQAIAMPATHRVIYTWRGEQLSNIPVDGLAHGLGASIMMVHRADLQNILYQAFGPEQIKLGTKCVDFAQDDVSVHARFEDGSEVAGDVLVIADGIRSRLRTKLLGEKALRYAGYATWRGIATLADEQIPVGVSSETWGRGRRIGLIPLNNGRMYWFSGWNTHAGAFIDESPAERKQRMRDLFRGWHKPIEAVIEATVPESIIRADVYELQPLHQWCKGRVALLGDAAHAMTPNMGQGACQAIEDGVALGVCLQKEQHVATALAEYQHKRIRRVHRVTTQSRRIGELSQLENPLACELRDAIAKRIYTPLLTHELDWLLSYAV